MKDKTIINISEKDGELEIKVSEIAYGNLVIIGALERIKHTLLTEDPEDLLEQRISNVTKNKRYDA